MIANARVVILADQILAEKDRLVGMDFEAFDRVDFFIFAGIQDERRI